VTTRCSVAGLKEFRISARIRRGRGVEVLAQLHPLDGNINCMVNGAGLASHHGHQAGGRRAGNFLDVGGGAGAGQIRNAFKI
jgi:succinyl-CoA synthetase beta subunit